MTFHPHEYMQNSFHSPGGTTCIHHFPKGIALFSRYNTLQLHYPIPDGKHHQPHTTAYTQFTEKSLAIAIDRSVADKHLFCYLGVCFFTANEAEEGQFTVRQPGKNSDIVT